MTPVGVFFCWQGGAERDFVNSTKVSRSKKAAPAKEESPTPEPVAVSGNTAPAAEIPAEPKEPAPPPRPVEEGKLVYLKLSELHPFHTFRPHPFKVTDDAKMQETVASIKANGVTAGLESHIF